MIEEPTAPLKAETQLKKLQIFRDLGYLPHAGQRRVHASTAPRRVLACGVRWGKSLCAAWEAVAAILEPTQRSIGWVVAPTYDLADKVFREILILVAEHLRHRLISVKEGDRRIILQNMAGGQSEVRAKSADNPTSLLGEGLHWLIIDEAARLKPAIWESHLSQRLIDKQGWCLMISTPRGKGWFYDAFRRGQGGDPEWESWNSPSWENPTLARERIEEERERLPERVFHQEYGGEFLEGAGAVFRYVRDAATGTWQYPAHHKRYIAGLDLARVSDYTVLVILDDQREVVAVDRFTRLDWSVQVSRIKALLDRYFNPRVLVDSTGAGEPVYEALRQAGCHAEPYILTARSKADIINALALALEKRQITLPEPDLWPEGIEELEGFQYSVTESGNVSTGAPAGQHDDCVIALALANWGAKRFSRVSFLAGGGGGSIPKSLSDEMEDVLGVRGSIDWPHLGSGSPF